MPEETDICFTGKEKVNPRSLLLSSEFLVPSSSLSTNSFNDNAIKLKRSYVAIKNASVYKKENMLS